MTRLRSIGARANKENAEEVAELRRRLSTVPANEWQRAYVLFDQIVALTGHVGPRGNKPIPRSCKFCKYYGHSQKFCDKKRDYEAQLLRAEMEALQRNERPVAPAEVPALIRG